MNTLECHHYQSDRCRSCQWIEKDLAHQIIEKENHLIQLLKTTPFYDNDYPSLLQETQSGPISEFRNKAKMVALGGAHNPSLGIENHHGKIVSLVDCPLYTPDMQELLLGIQEWIQVAGIPPYRKDKQKGELKYVLVTQNRQNEFMVRLVLRSLDIQKRIEERLPLLQEKFPKIKVLTINIQSEHKAIIEGHQEIILSDKNYLVESLNDIPLAMTPGGFFQTNSHLAETLYKTASLWAYSTVEQMNNQCHLDKNNAEINIWDLFCGVGGFGISISQYFKKQLLNPILTGIEISPEAIHAATTTANKIHLKNISFQAMDSQDYTSNKTFVKKYEKSNSPHIMIVNPPRRGISQSVCEFIESSQVLSIIYSSCEAKTLASDLCMMPSYEIKKIQIFDLFPHTAHYETLCLLQRKSS